jgi:predicted RNase H-like nuclease
VFPAPLRPALNARTYESACRITEKLSGRGISRQAWGIQAKVRDIDEALLARPHLQGRVREIHPEVSFWAWNRSHPMEHAKRTDAGRKERLALIAGVYGRAAFGKVRERYPRALAGDDDILDAFAALWTAERIALGMASTLPDAPPVDTEGLRMEIVY